MSLTLTRYWAVNGQWVRKSNPIGPPIDPPPAPGTYRPSASTTGHTGSLVTWNGNLSTTTEGEVWENLLIKGRVLPKANNVTMRNCWVAGPDGGLTTAGALVYAPDNWQSGFIIEDCTIAPSTPTVYANGLQGGNMTARRCNIHDVTDGVILFGGTATTVEASYVHDLRHWASDPAQGGGPSHDDGCQIEGGSNITLVGNSIEGNVEGNSAIQCTQNYTLMTNLTIDRNWLGGGNISLITSEKSKGPYTNFRVTDNRFLHNSRSGVDGAITSTTKAVATITGNVIDATGAPVTFINAGS